MDHMLLASLARRLARFWTEVAVAYEHGSLPPLSAVNSLRSVHLLLRSFMEGGPLALASMMFFLKDLHDEELTKQVHQVVEQARMVEGTLTEPENPPAS